MFGRFGGKEEYMEFMNDFIEKYDGSMKDFLDRISVSFFIKFVEYK